MTTEPGRRGKKSNVGLIYCAMICTTLVLITLISVLGK